MGRCEGTQLFDWLSAQCHLSSITYWQDRECRDLEWAAKSVAVIEERQHGENVRMSGLVCQITGFLSLFVYVCVHVLLCLCCNWIVAGSLLVTRKAHLRAASSALVIIKTEWRWNKQLRNEMWFEMTTNCTLQCFIYLAFQPIKLCWNLFPLLHSSVFFSCLFCILKRDLFRWFVRMDFRFAVRRLHKKIILLQWFHHFLPVLMSVVFWTVSEFCTFSTCPCALRPWFVVFSHSPKTCSKWSIHEGVREC